MNYILKNNKIQCWGHGEIAFALIDELPKGLVETKTDVFAKGNTGNSHTFKGGKIYLKNEGQYVTGYFHAKNTKLYHPEHSPKGCVLPDGFYEIRRQSEFINGEMRVVVD
jgi:hypothetical protein